MDRETWPRIKLLLRKEVTYLISGEHSQVVRVYGARNRGFSTYCEISGLERYLNTVVSQDELPRVLFIHLHHCKLCEIDCAATTSVRQL